MLSSNFACVDIKSSYNHEKNEETSVGDNVFKPSNEWQTVPKG